MQTRPMFKGQRPPMMDMAPVKSSISDLTTRMAELEVRVEKLESLWIVRFFRWIGGK